MCKIRLLSFATSLFLYVSDQYNIVVHMAVLITLYKRKVFKKFKINTEIAKIKIARTSP